MLKVIINALLLGISLAMDASAVSMANGMKENKMLTRKIIFISLLFAIFQGVMLLIGYLLSHYAFESLSWIDSPSTKWIIPTIALTLLLFIGIKMLIEGIKNNAKSKGEEKENALVKISISAILVQAIATSIDALCVGVSISDYKTLEMIITISVIVLLTFSICVPSHFIGKKFGNKFQGKAEIIGGVILILVGIEIFITGLLF